MDPAELAKRVSTRNCLRLPELRCAKHPRGAGADARYAGEEVAEAPRAFTLRRLPARAAVKLYPRLKARQLRPAACALAAC